ncbi:hypothetical protein AGABI1DRAFT_107699 [Agaricus bisporus var. burnettii JB137-S8]|uniref:CENP-V/GFA domain-containing protein n=1 Tax=Agaricus bisporus var. burnettii (strain JB137-S8 / ATCC MYA-4627 / FGSC 10392) TaxID=597362 RepID=K5X4L2_AGABU|nr:uncharacterized protein AGABI1DRAFT_107699 [Agaricus bisporus var. burnettii JB137-S8]EKM77882.1 hypothetical protein AGABI1DRAFT_107699 [Agaricus bisporus var. burnettii JB137-S8]
MTEGKTRDTTTVRRGSCLCQAVKYEVRGDPLTFRVCHCVNCRKATGSAFMSNGFFLKTQVHVVEGGDKMKAYRDNDTESEIPVDRRFCTNCGSNVFMNSAEPEAEKKFIIICLGTLDEKVSWQPKTQLFPHEQRHWVAGINTLVTPKSKL